MTVYNSTKAGNTTPKYLDSAAGINTIATYTFGTTNLPTLKIGDTFLMMPVAVGCSIFDIALDIDNLDGGVGPTLTLNVGDTINPARFMTNVVAGRTGGYVTSNVNGWTGFTYPTNTNILITVTGNAAGAVSANAALRMFVSYTADP